ncbi:hypothetical protein V1512DRAFT_261402 [Lipomyces arxii]|uniref:uncharacterized protein n=1 Tax=Lipomyces arxii TaxID=56418 RepID=UPI0034CDFD1B
MSAPQGGHDIDLPVEPPSVLHIAPTAEPIQDLTGSSELKKELALELQHQSQSPQPTDSSVPDSNQSSTASPYGTRSRGRQARVNYREDTEDDDLLSGSLRTVLAAKDKIPTTTDKKRKLPTSKAVVADPSLNIAIKLNGTSNPLPRKRVAVATHSDPATISVNEKSSPAASKPTRSSDRRTASSITRKSSATSSSVRSQSVSQSKSTSPAPRTRSGAIQRKPESAKFNFATNVLDFSEAKIAKGSLILQDNSVYAPNDCVYLVSEPPSEPYYIGRIMEFIERPVSSQKASGSSIWDSYQVRINWFYRPKDIPTRSSDSRLLFATMHSDLCPLLSLRGKCYVAHKAHVKDLVEYRKQPDHFLVDKLYDRYICRFYEMIPTEKILNVPDTFGRILRERVKFGVVEIGRGKDLCTAARTCVRCGQWCSPDESVCCAVCENDYHMSCVRPALLKKPSRGFAWSCAVCSRDKERELAESKGKLLPGSIEDEFDETMVDAEDPANAAGNSEASGSGETTPDETEIQPASRTAFKVADDKLSNEQKRELSLWPYRYLGIHCKLGEILDNNDRIFPRAASRLGNKHQAVVAEWGGRPVQFVEREPPKSKKKKQSKPLSRKSSKDESSVLDDTIPLSSSTTSVTVANGISLNDPWVQVKPNGYIERGGDDTVRLLWMTPETVPAEKIDEFLDNTKSYAKALKMLPSSPNFIDQCLGALMECQFDEKLALKLVSKFTRKSLKEPTLTAIEVKKFEDAVRRYGSELHPVFKAVGTVSSADIVRFYYLWKKTPSGHAIWDHFEGRRHKRDQLKSKTEDSSLVPGEHTQHLVDDVADSQDDSAYDMSKCRTQKQTFKCKFCKTPKSRAWRRAPGFPIAQSRSTTALCVRCAELWRRYAVMWEEPEEVLRRALQRGSHGKKRQVEEELLRELDEGNRYENFASDLSDVESEVIEQTQPKIEADEPPPEKKVQNRKQVKSVSVPQTKTPLSSQSRTPPATQSKSGSQAKGASASVTAEPATNGSSKKKTMAAVRERQAQTECGVCGLLEPIDKLLRCHDCHMGVHRSCYGVRVVRRKWRCDPCRNDKRPSHSIVYNCVICPAKVSKDIANVANGERQPRDALKPTAGNNWVHVTCAVWTPEIKFTDSYAMSVAEGVPMIPKAKLIEICDICQTRQGACINCAACQVPFHIGCAQKANYQFRFDTRPVKSTRRERVPVVKFGLETGSLTPLVWCPKHSLRKMLVHSMTEPSPANSLTDPSVTSLIGGGLGPERNVLNLYTQTYKQADLSLTGTVRLAQQTAAAVDFNLTSLAALMETQKGKTFFESIGVHSPDSDDTVTESNSDTESVQSAEDASTAGSIEPVMEEEIKS